MKKRGFLVDYLKIATLHAERLSAALSETERLLPFSAKTFETLSNQDIAFLDMLTTRFSKLQDVIGTQIFPLILECLAEDASSFIDKLNRLEKLGYLEDAGWWMKLREIRNQVTHDYPDDYALLAQHFNQFVILSRELLTYLVILKQKAISLPEVGKGS